MPLWLLMLLALGALCGGAYVWVAWVIARFPDDETNEAGADRP